MKLLKIIHASDNIHKYIAVLIDKNNKEYKIKFGSKSYSDYTKHKDPERKKLYIKRHSKNEDWTKKGILTAGFWSRWILWNKPSLRDSIQNTKQRFNL